MSEKRSQILILDPPVDLVFKGPFNEVVTSTLSLRNPTNDPVIFKVKTTAPKQYCVRPNSGLLGAKDEAVISVMLQPFDSSSAEKSKHKFMVQTLNAPPKFKLENLDAVWREAPKSQLMDSKLRCVFLDSDGNVQDPTASALSITANEGASSNAALPEETFKSSSMVTTSPPAPAVTATPKQPEVVSSTQSTAGSTPAHVGGSNIVNKEMEKAAAESKVRMLQDKIDQLSSENVQLKSESNRLRQRIGAGGVGSTSTFKKGASSLSVIAIIFILIAIILGYFVGKWL